MPDTQLLGLIIAAIVAFVVLFRLYTVLGRRTGHEPTADRRPARAAAGRCPGRAAGRCRMRLATLSAGA